MDEKKRLQKLILLTAKEVCSFCELNGIPYFIIGGTQLGAIRHKGFIPWDDDFDIGMKRLDYERFIEIWTKKCDKEKFFLQTQDSEMYYTFSFCKVQLKGTKILEDFSKNVPIQHGIFVDIFPYDNLPDKKMKRTIFLLKNHIVKNMLWVKCGYGTDEQRKSLKYKLFKVLGCFASVRRLKKIQNKLVTRYNKSNTAYCFNCDYPKQQISIEWISNLRKYQFEEECFYGVEDYDAYLKHMYGDYMELPPVEKRIQHSYEKIVFGPYEDL